MADYLLSDEMDGERLDLLDTPSPLNTEARYLLKKERLLTSLTIPHCEEPAAPSRFRVCFLPVRRLIAKIGANTLRPSPSNILLHVCAM